MTIECIKNVYMDKKDTPCPITEKLIKAGYQQVYGGYIKYAKDNLVTVDYRKALPTQWWHLIKSYCERREQQDYFRKSIVCGELILWMAEVLECVSNEELSNLVDRIIKSSRPKRRYDSKKPSVVYDRKKWNLEIKKLCFDRIIRTIENNNAIID